MLAAAAFLRDRRAFFERAASRGDVVPLRLGHRRLLLVNDPDLVREVFVTRAASFSRGFPARFLRPVLGDGLLTAEGPSWARQRPITRSAVDTAALPATLEQMAAAIARRCGTWHAGQFFDARHELGALTYEVGCAALLGADGPELPADLAAAWRGVWRGVFGVADLTWLAAGLPAVLETDGRRALRLIDRTIARLVRERRGAAPRRDVLGHLMEHAASDGEVRDQLVTLLFTSQDTTSVGLTWACALVARDEAVADRVCAEARAVFGDGPLTGGAVSRLTFTGAVVLEALRLYPPVWLESRDAIETCEVGPHRVERGVTVVVSPWLVQRDPRHYDRPHDFVPDRWLRADPPAMGGAYFPFGLGPRYCVGDRYARALMTLALAAIARRHRLRIVPGQRIEVDARITLRPAPALWMRVEDA
ncbi:MAG TPA: cytochrome P450 [Candidatus Limnocylindria bacterium]|nr:cytochrome P450 [Candidatus Limnocylindria bacterium]